MALVNPTYFMFGISLLAGIILYYIQRQYLGEKDNIRKKQTQKRNKTERSK